MMILRISDFNICVKFAGVGGDNIEKLPAQYTPFVLSDKAVSADFLFTLVVDNDFRFLKDNIEIGTFEEDGFTHKVFRLNDGGYLFEMYDSMNADTLVYKMQVTADFGNVVVALYGKGTWWQHGFNNALMITFALASASHGTLLMHSSVTVYNEGGYLFLGPSGTGKSTHSSLWLKHVEGTELLNDDNPVVRVFDDDVIVYGSPWSGKTPCYQNKQVPAKAFVMLQQKPKNCIKRKDVIESFVALLESCSSFSWDKPIHRVICNTISEIIRKIPIFHLECLPDADAVRVCKNAVAQ